MDNTHMQDLLPAYALDALEEDEVTQVEAHLANCAVCQEELHSFEQVTAELNHALPVMTAPPALKGRLMERISSSEPVHQPQEEPRWKRLFTLGPVLALAALVVLVVGAALLNRPEVVELASSEFAPQATGQLVLGRDGRTARLVVDNLPPLPQDQQYQLWLIAGDDRESGGVFSVEGDGSASLRVNAPQELNSYTAFGITVEPRGGSPSPTGVRALGTHD